MKLSLRENCLFLLNSFETRLAYFVTHQLFQIFLPWGLGSGTTYISFKQKYIQQNVLLHQ